jgi:asparaginyl-tRNA synthetase
VGEDFGGDEGSGAGEQFRDRLLVHRYPAAVKAFYEERPQGRTSLCVSTSAEGYGRSSAAVSARTPAPERRSRRTSAGRGVLRGTDLSRYGSGPTAGFGMGIERMVAWLCGLNHVRETIPFPRMLERLTP